MYNANIFIRDYKSAVIESFREIRESECTASRDEKARKKIKAMNDQRKREGKKIPDHPLVCRTMKRLPSPGIY